MAYIITTTPYGPGHYVGRNYLDKYRALDTLEPLTRHYGGQLPAPGALVFDSIDDAAGYCERLHDSGKLYVREYSPALNHAGRCVWQVTP